LKRPLTWRPKERFDELVPRNPITITDGAPQMPVPSMRAQRLGFSPAWRQVSGPCALGIVGLAIAVILWGYGYKLSLYHRNAAPSARIPVAKLWIGPRSASVAATSRIKELSHPVSGSKAFVVHIQWLPSLSRAVASVPQLTEYRVAFCELQIPSRAPPPFRFLLA